MGQQFSAFDADTHTIIDSDLVLDLPTITKTVGNIHDWCSNPYLNTLLSAIDAGYRPVLVGDEVFDSKSDKVIQHMVTLMNLDFHPKDILKPVKLKFHSSTGEATYRYVVNHSKELYLDRERNCVSHITACTDTGKPEIVRTEALPLLLAIGTGIYRDHAPICDSIRPEGDHFGYWLTYRDGYGDEASVGFDPDYYGTNEELCGCWCGDRLSVTNDEAELEDFEEYFSPFADNIYMIRDTDEEIRSILREKKIGLLNVKNLSKLYTALRKEN